ATSRPLARRTTSTGLFSGCALKGTAAGLAGSARQHQGQPRHHIAWNSTRKPLHRDFCCSAIFVAHCLVPNDSGSHALTLASERCAGLCFNCASDAIGGAADAAGLAAALVTA